MVLAVLMWMSALAGCGGQPPAPPPAPKTVYDHFAIGVGGKVASIQVAVLLPEMERGLMQRPDLGKDEGMIFAYDKPQQMNFWMHNTPEPLDIGFFTPEGVLAEVYPLLPFDEKTVSSRSHELQFAVEMPMGWYSANGVRAGARLDMKALAAALKARGFDPAKLGL
jgi:uncharacterized protein